MEKEFDKEYAPTMSVDIKNVQIKVNDKRIQIQIWDCCGNNKFALETPNLFKKASISIFIYDIHNKESYEEFEAWYNMLKKHSECNIIFLIGNKNDLKEKREVTLEEVKAFKNKYDDIKICLEISALYFTDIVKVFENIAISIYEKIEENEENNAQKKIITKKRLLLIYS